jgi:hypothetical protein
MKWCMLGSGLRKEGEVVMFDIQDTAISLYGRVQRGHTALFLQAVYAETVSQLGIVHYL